MQSQPDPTLVTEFLKEGIQQIMRNLSIVQGETVDALTAHQLEVEADKYLSEICVVGSQIGFDAKTRQVKLDMLICLTKEGREKMAEWQTRKATAILNSKHS